MVKITEAEVWALNLLTGSIANAEAELGRLVAARNAYVALLENKYGANYNPLTGELTPREPDKGA